MADFGEHSKEPVDSLIGWSNHQLFNDNPAPELVLGSTLLITKSNVEHDTEPVQSSSYPYNPFL
jgi:hypothetical protein